MNKGGLIEMIILIILVILLIFSTSIYLSFSSVNEETITIKDKERINEMDSSYYLVFTEDEVFKNTDSLLHLKFDSSDVYNKLEVGKTYNVKVNWYRIKFISEYRNILEILE